MARGWIDLAKLKEMVPVVIAGALWGTGKHVCLHNTDKMAILRSRITKSPLPMHLVAVLCLL
jgi:hypothetical protein